MALKYITLDNLWPIVFPAWMDHRTLANAIINTGQYHQVTGAGFVRRKANGKLECYDESIALGVKAANNDTDLVAMCYGRALSDGPP